MGPRSGCDRTLRLFPERRTATSGRLRGRRPKDKDSIGERCKKASCQIAHPSISRRDRENSGPAHQVVGCKRAVYRVSALASAPAACRAKWSGRTYRRSLSHIHCCICACIYLNRSSLPRRGPKSQPWKPWPQKQRERHGACERSRINARCFIAHCLTLRVIRSQE